MKRYLIIALVLLSASITSSGQDAQIREIMGKLDTDRVSLTYSCTYSGQAPLKLNGTLLLQGDCYVAKGNGTEIYCNGGTRWTVDPQEREVYIEDADGIREVLDYKEGLSDLKLSGIKYSPSSSDLSAFTFDTASLGSAWVVTDLR